MTTWCQMFEIPVQRLTVGKGTVPYIHVVGIPGASPVRQFKPGPDSMTKTHAKKSEQKVRGASPRKYLGTVRRKYWDYVWKCATFRFPLISDNKLVGPCPYLYETDSAPTDPPDSSRLSATAAIFPLRNNKTRPSEQAKCQREIMTNSL